MGWYRKKPIVIEAEYIASYMEIPRIASWIEAQGGKCAYGQEEGEGVKLLLSTLEGVMTAAVGDYILRGVAGEFYPCKADIFHATYEAVEEP